MMSHDLSANGFWLRIRACLIIARSLSTKTEGKRVPESMEESTIDDPEDTKSNGDSDLITEQESGVVVRFDIGRFVLCHRKLCQLTEPFVKCHESFNFITRFVSQLEVAL